MSQIQYHLDCITYLEAERRYNYILDTSIACQGRTEDVNNALAELKRVMEMDGVLNGSG